MCQVGKTGSKHINMVKTSPQCCEIVCPSLYISENGILFRAVLLCTKLQVLDILWKNCFDIQSQTLHSAELLHHANIYTKYSKTLRHTLTHPPTHTHACPYTVTTYYTTHTKIHTHTHRGTCMHVHTHTHTFRDLPVWQRAAIWPVTQKSFGCRCQTPKPHPEDNTKTNIQYRGQWRAIFTPAPNLLTNRFQIFRLQNSFSIFRPGKNGENWLQNHL